MIKRVTALALAVFLMASSCPLPAFAHDFSVPGGQTASPPPSPGAAGQEPPNNPACEDPNVQCGFDPVDIFRGEFLLTRQDVALPGRGLSVDLTFSYGSRSAYNGPFGYGWDLSYNKRLRKLANNNVMLLRGDHRKDEFVASGTTYTAPPGIYDTLTQNPNGTYTLTSTHGDKELYDLNGNLSQLQDRNGNTITFTYTATQMPITGSSPYFVNQATGLVAREYLLTQITDTIGRAIAFTYNATGHLATITYDNGTRTIAYAYNPNGNGDLASVTTPPTAQSPSGAVTTYAYTNHNLISSTDPKGQTYLTNTYNTTTDRLTSQTYGGATSSIVYGTNAGSQAIADVTDRRGFLTRYTFDTAGHITQMEQFTDLNPSGEPSSYVTQYQYNAAGERIRVVFPRGNSIEYTYDTNGNQTTLRRKPIPPSATPDLVTIFSYEPTFNFIKVLRDPNGKGSAYFYDYEEAALGDLNGDGITTQNAGNLVRIITGLTIPPPPPPPTPINQWASTVIGFSSQYSSSSWSAAQALGAPNTYPLYGDISTAWTSLAQNAGLEYLELGYATPVYLTGVDIYETYNPGAVVQVLARPAGGTWQSVWSGPPQTGLPAQSRIFSPPVAPTTYLVSQIRIELNTAAIPGWNEIDAVKLIGTTALQQPPTPPNPFTGIPTTFVSNSSGQVTKVTDPNINATQYTYNPATGYLTQITQGFGTPQAATTMLGYDSVGNITSLTNANNATTSFIYNPLNQLTQVTAPAPFNFQTRYRYDANGNLRQVDRQAASANPGAQPTLGSVSAIDGWQSTVYAYTVVDQLASITDDLNHATSFTYDPNGNRTAITDANNATTTYTYHERNLLWKVTDAATPPGITESLYDLNGNQTSLKDANTNTTAYAYDNFDRLITTTYANNSTEQYSYDAASNLTSRLTPANQTIAYVYDALNRLTNKNYPATSTLNVTYAYDSGSRLQSANTTAANNSFSYDALNRVISNTQTLAGVATPFIVGSTYDGVGNRTALTYPVGITLNPGFDALNRLTTIGAYGYPLVSYTYDALSRRTQRDINAPIIQRTTYGYDAASRLATLNSSLVGVGTFARGYTHDPVGNQLTKAEGLGVPPPTGTTYGYDPLHQLTSVTPPGTPATTYTQDPVGNRTQVVTGATTTPYAHNTLNQYTQVGTASLTYDLNGNLTTDGVRTYTYDAENRLITATGPGLSASYTYDAFGRRVAKTVNGQTTRFLYDGDQLLEDRSATGAFLALYGYGSGIDEVLLRYTNANQLQVYHHDHLGSAQFLLDFAGTPLEGTVYDAYGTPSSPSAIGNRFLFTGREYDQETGLYYYRARYYSPTLGRFLSRDPAPGFVELPHTLHPYTYVWNNPINLKDPSGEAVPLWVVLALVGAVYGGIFEGNLAGVIAGGVGSLAGTLVGTSTGNPALAGASAGFFYDLTRQVVQNATGNQCQPGSSINLASLAVNTAGGALIGPVPGKIPGLGLVGRHPNVFRPRSLNEFGPNSIRLLLQEEVGAILGGIFDQFYGVSQQQ